jgi:hypothetical protein
VLQNFGEVLVNSITSWHTSAVGIQLEPMPDLHLSRRSTETLVVTLIVTAVSALAVVAYRYPLGYRKLAGALGTIVTLYSGGTILFRLGRMRSVIHTLDESLKAQANEPLSHVGWMITGQEQDAVSIRRIMVVWVLVLGYFAVLWFLPTILGTQVPSH